MKEAILLWSKSLRSLKEASSCRVLKLYTPHTFEQPSHEPSSIGDDSFIEGICTVWEHLQVMLLVRRNLFLLNIDYYQCINVCD